ncbi:MAG: thiol:disulfide interchange protein [Gemmatimonadetes bacterium]|nr:MAG: thiol:disulfide interchange protein [Gemmatimonadota bacterium]
MNRRLLSLITLLITSSFLWSTLVSAKSVKTDHVEAELVTPLESIQPGQTFEVALRLKMQKEWHVYWENPGDAGLPPEIEWKLPDGFKVGEIKWPYPHRISVEGVTNYGFGGEIFLISEVTAPETLNEDPVEIKATANWLVCKDICIPESVDLSLTLPVRAETPSINPKWQEAFAHTRTLLPLELKDWQVEAAKTDSFVIFQITPPEWFDAELTDVEFFCRQEMVVNHNAKQYLTKNGNQYHLKVRLDEYAEEIPEKISGVLVSSVGWRGPGSEKALNVDTPLKSSFSETTVSQSAPTPGVAAGQILLMFLSAFLGGMILNLMPCVLPVLSLKILGFVKQANESHTSPWVHGLVFTLGVLISFWALAGVLLILRAGGEQLGWGFQLQSPPFLIALSLLMFLMGLNMFGVFEIGESLTGVGASQQNKGGFAGSFFSGILATIVATPCTAPFMGAALGFALVQPAWISIMVFTALGLGMAFPYVVLTSSPALLKYVPKPGRWMESLKQFMGFLLMATVVWLVWTLGHQTGINTVSVLLIGLLTAGLGVWVWGRWSEEDGIPLIIARTVAILALMGGILFSFSGTKFAEAPVEAAPLEATSQHGVVWEPFSPERVAELKAAGTPYFIDFTAKWCLSCQVNKKVALHSAKVEKKFAELGVVTLEADWTSRDPVIGEEIAKFGRNSVPVYVFSTGKPGEAPVLLPEILTPEIILKELKRLEL